MSVNPSNQQPITNKKYEHIRSLKPSARACDGCEIRPYKLNNKVLVRNTINNVKGDTNNFKMYNELISLSENITKEKLEQKARQIVADENNDAYYIVYKNKNNKTDHFKMNGKVMLFSKQDFIDGFIESDPTFTPSIYTIPLSSRHDGGKKRKSRKNIQHKRKTIKNKRKSRMKR
jgi:hypothetical protein